MRLQIKGNQNWNSYSQCSLIGENELSFFDCTVLRAAKLAAKDPNGKSDPYCRVYLGAADHIMHRTEVKAGTLNPEWKETFTLFGGELAPFLHTQG